MPGPPTPREAVFLREFREDLVYWISADRRTALRLMRIVEEVLRDPFVGIGKPEPLRNVGPDTWSRRLTIEHRVVYVISETRVEFVKAKGHY